MACAFVEFQKMIVAIPWKLSFEIHTKVSNLAQMKSDEL